ncbi:Carboxypeptidase regulatory-like domain-containing protein [Granulicella rosea]|uniref:Carboxypeptidase regulatory-like domain-containing protein n=1 Tax=Granulicella rosea TaxID=474952 RepID=A0A239MN72_9BACT|nr:carboxypeptidase-like regulatory domain-containing protein [Granulicella rosea]SNT44105.1 Carboxypeptidase regulatory-like domain-containing protein [Granulicella rosea]
MKKFFPTIFLAGALLAPASLLGQVSSSTISGSVADTTGAVIPGAKVVATNTATNVKTVSITDSAGSYTLPFLPPGSYTVEVDAPQFKHYKQSQLNLSAGDHPNIDVHLELGGSDQVVQVTADAPLLGTADASNGQVVTTKQVESLPLNGRTPMVLTQYTAGVVSTTTPGAVHAYDNSAVSAFSIGGLPNKTSEILIDGAPDNASDNSAAYSPMVDAVAEVRIHTFESDAAYGHTGGGVANQITKSGTNRIHGSGWEFNQINNLAANNYFNKRTGTQLAAYQYNQYGGTIGGPVFIPKVFNGKDKLFFFFGYEGIHNNAPGQVTTSVPTAAELKGDFSQTLASGCPGGYANNPATAAAICLPYGTQTTNYADPGQLYNPSTGTLSGTLVTRQPYLNNQIPTSSFNSVATALAAYYPGANVTGNSDGSNNYSGAVPGGDRYDNEFFRVDYNISQNNKLFATIRRNNRNNFANEFFGANDIAIGDILTRRNWGGTLGDVYTISPTLIGESRINYTRYVQNQTSPAQGFGATSLGLPSYVQTNAQILLFPQVKFGSCTTAVIQCLGTSTTSPGLGVFNSFGVYTDLIKIVRNHTLKIGFDGREYQKGGFTYGASQGAYTFDASYVQATNASSTSTNSLIGNDLAAFLLGLPTTASYDVNAKEVAQNKYLAAFLQDDWRVSNKLTLNMGLRFDQDFSPYERDNRIVNGFAATTANPIAAAAQTAYAAHPIALLPAANFAVNGGLTFANAQNRNMYDVQSHTFSPRVGFSFTPKADGKTAIRGGFGIFVLPELPYQNAINQEGFSQTTQAQTTTNSYLTANATLSNPFPAGILAPAGSSAGLATFNGQAITFFSPVVHNGYSERWTLGVQHQLPGNYLLEVAYVGNHALKLPINQQLNYIPKQYLAATTDPTLNATVKTQLNTNVTNPLAGLLPNGAGSINSSTTATYQLLLKYPEYPLNGVTLQNAPAGSSYFDALDVRVEKRPGKGITFLVNYQWSKVLERVTYLNNFDASPELRISQYDHPNHMVAAVTYDLPYGRGRIFGDKGSKFLTIPLGGWTINSIYTYQTGAPLTLGNVIRYAGVPLNYNDRQTAPKVSSFNTAAFDIAAADQPTYNVRTLPSQFSNFRIDSINDWDGSIMKAFNFTEHTYLQIRAEAFNVNNRPQFGAPNLTPTSSAFGQITSQANTPRVLQLGARLSF